MTALTTVMIGTLLALGAATADLPAGAPPAVDAAPAVDGGPAVVTWDPDRHIVAELPPPLFPDALDRTLACQLVLLLGLALVAARAGQLLDDARRIPRPDLAVLAALTAVGTALRVVGGPRFPVFQRGGGYSLVRDILFHPAHAYNHRGNGLEALHGLLLHVLPRTDASVLGVHLALSVATIPAAWAVARLWLRDRSTALWAAAVVAVSPVIVFLGWSEADLVPGTFFALCTLALAGVAARRADATLAVATAVVAAFTVQVFPTLHLLPAVLAAFVLSVPEHRVLLRRPSTWLAAALFLGLWLEPAMVAWSGLAEGRNGAPSPLEHGPLLQALFLPFRSDLSGRPGNVFLDGTLTPPALPVLALIGVAFGLARRGRRLPTLALVAVGVGLTATGLALGRINLMRYQLAAQVFYALLAGQGLAALGALLARVPPRRPRLNAGLLAVALGASVALDPGLVGQVFTPPLERRFLGEALAQVADDCVILTPEPIPGRRAELPTYLSRELGLHHSWGTVRPGKLPPAVTRAPCVVYYRPLECWDFQQGPGAPEEPGRTFRAGCADLEARLALQPLVRRDLPALPDQYDVYRADRLEVGFFKVLGPR